MSRNAVWKAVGELKKDGYRFDAVSGRGYALLCDNDVLEKDGIYNNLKNKDFYYIDVFDEVNSTNKIARQKASDGEKEGYVCIASSQTEGRGRMGRNFFSPDKSGLYLSIILRPRISVQSSALITTAAASAVARAIDFLSGENSKIKWVNDIFVNGKKCAEYLPRHQPRLKKADSTMQFWVSALTFMRRAEDFLKKSKTLQGACLTSKKAI